MPSTGWTNASPARAWRRCHPTGCAWAWRCPSAQIDPHFFFNTLNTIAELIHADSERAEATVERLAEMFRYVLDGSERGLVPLAQELAFPDDYLEIERARFGDRLRVTRDVAPEAMEVLVPSLDLQPLVENAVQHGPGADGSIDLSISIHTHGSRAVIAIRDQGPGRCARSWVGRKPATCSTTDE